MKQTFFILTLSPLLFLLSCAPGPLTLKISSKQDMGYSIVTYGGFQSDTLLTGTVSAGKILEIPVSYRGFALLTINNTFPYPLIFGKGDIRMDFERPGVSPVIKESEENRFFYDYYANYNILNSRLRLYNDSKARLGEKDPFYPAIVAQIDSVEHQKEAMSARLPNKEFPVASAILREKQIEAKSYGIKTLGELHQVQKEFTGFASRNYPYIENSEQLSALIRQSFMMLEYINYYNIIEKTGNKKMDIGKSQDLFRKEMLEQTQMWTDALEPYVPAPVSLAQCVKAYYDRAMLSNAMEIISANTEIAVCGGDAQGRISFPGSFDILKGDGLAKTSTQMLYPEKIIVLVDDACVFSKVLAIQLAKAYELKTTPIIIVPKTKAGPGMYALDRLCSKDLYFAENTDWIPEDVLARHKYPYFIMLDESNKVIKESGDLKVFQGKPQGDYGQK